MLKSFDDDSHVNTRVAQYEAYHNGKAFQIAKQFVIARIEGQNRILEKYSLKTHNPKLLLAVENIEFTDMKALRQKLTGIEGKCSQGYFQQIFNLLPAKLNPKSRKKFQAYDGVNNLFNLAYEMLSWRVYRALIKAKLEPFLGFLHAPKHERPSLTCDFVELYRFLIEDFIIIQCKEYCKKDFMFKTEAVHGKMGKRQYLSDTKTKEFMKRLDMHFGRKVDIPRIYLGKQQIWETLINEEALQLARYLRGTLESWRLRIATLKNLSCYDN